MSNDSTLHETRPEQAGRNAESNTAARTAPSCIRELKQEGKISLNCLISKADIGRTNKGTPYLSLTLEDATGVLDAKFWNLTEEQAGSWHAGQIVKASGDLILYRNAWQLRLHTMSEIPDAEVTDYVRSAPKSRAQMEEEVRQLVAGIENPVISQIVSGILEQYSREFFSWPAAVRNHHNFPGGLAYHSLCMAELAQDVLKQYSWLDYDLLIAGILLHDIGKIEELSAAILPEYTPAGNLVGHISMAASYIDRMARFLEAENSEEVMLLKHMVLSHHGKMEYGSPVLPMIPEAEVLTLLDNLDARMVMIRQTLDSVEPGSFGPRVFALDNRMFYRRKTDEPSQAEDSDPEE